MLSYLPVNFFYFGASRDSLIYEDECVAHVLSTEDEFTCISVRDEPGLRRPWQPRPPGYKLPLRAILGVERLWGSVGTVLCYFSGNSIWPI